VNSALWLAHITELTVLEHLGEALLNCADGAPWRGVVAEKAQGRSRVAGSVLHPSGNVTAVTGMAR